MARMNRGEIKSTRPILSRLLQNRVVSAVIVGIFLLSRRFTNIASTSDSLSVFLSKIFGDSSIARDSVSKEPNISKADTGLASSETYISTSKVLTDTVYVTDDVGGQATIDDDQNMSFFKNISNLSLAADTFDRTFIASRSFSETSTISDSSSISTDKPVSEALTSTDLFSYLADKYSYDTLSAADSGEGLKQDYVDNGFYFAEDYVGSKFNFT